MRMSTKRFKAATLMAGAISAGVLATSPAAFAATNTSNLSVSATVQGFCTISDGTLAFGNLSATGSQGASGSSDKDGSATITAMCNKGTVGTISANMGNNSANNIRQMASGANRLSYELYTDSGRTTKLLSDTTSFSITGAGTSETKTIYGRIPGGTNMNDAPNGTYSDIVVLTIAYGL